MNWIILVYILLFTVRCVSNFRDCLNVKKIFQIPFYKKKDIKLELLYVLTNVFLLYYNKNVHVS